MLVRFFLNSDRNRLVKFLFLFLVFSATTFLFGISNGSADSSTLRSTMRVLLPNGITIKVVKKYFKNMPADYARIYEKKKLLRWRIFIEPLGKHAYKRTYVLPEQFFLSYLISRVEPHIDQVYISVPVINVSGTTIETKKVYRSVKYNRIGPNRWHSPGAEAAGKKGMKFSSYILNSGKRVYVSKLAHIFDENPAHKYVRLFAIKYDDTLRVLSPEYLKDLTNIVSFFNSSKPNKISHDILFFFKEKKSHHIWPKENSEVRIIRRKKAPSIVVLSHGTKTLKQDSKFFYAEIFLSTRLDREGSRIAFSRQPINYIKKNLLGPNEKKEEMPVALDAQYKKQLIRHLLKSYDFTSEEKAAVKRAAIRFISLSKNNQKVIEEDFFCNKTAANEWCMN